MAALSPTHKGFLVAIVATMTIALGWGSCIVYWHFKIRSAFRIFEESGIPLNSVNPESKSERAFSTLTDAGCRTLPYLVDALDDAKEPAVLSILTFWIAWEATFPGLPWAEASSPELDRHMEAWHFLPHARPEERRIKCERIRTWWKEHGADHHQFWRFWTSACKPIEREGPGP